MSRKQMLVWETFINHIKILRLKEILIKLNTFPLINNLINQLKGSSLITSKINSYQWTPPELIIRKNTLNQIDAIYEIYEIWKKKFFLLKNWSEIKLI